MTSHTPVTSDLCAAPATVTLTFEKYSLSLLLGPTAT